MSAIKKYRIEILSIVLAVLFSHGLLLLNDGYYWEDGKIMRWIRMGYWDDLYANYQMAGAPYAVYVYRLIHYFSDSLFIYKLIVFLGLFSTTFLVFIIAIRSQFLTCLESLWVALFFASYPGVKTWGSSVILVSYPLYIFIFFLACIVAMNAFPRTFNFYKSVILRVLSLGLFFLSFIMQSFLCFIFGFLGYWYFLEQRGQEGKILFSPVTIINFLISRIDYIILPFLFWLIKKTFFAPHGIFVDYNRIIRYSLMPFLREAFLFVYSVFKEFNGTLSSLLDNPVYSLVLIVLWLFIVRKGCKSAGDALATDAEIAPTRSVILFGILLFAIAIFPYVVVGKPPVDGYESRHLMLTPLPLALLIVGLSRLVSRKHSSEIRWALLACILSGFVIRSADNYLLWQARWLKSSSIIHQLTSRPELSRYDSFIIIDHFGIGDEGTEWAIHLKNAWGEGERNVYYDREYDQGIGKALSQDNQQDSVVIEAYKGSGEDEKLIVLKYFYRKFINRGENVQGLLDRIVFIKTSTLSS